MDDCLTCDYDRFLNPGNQCIEECAPGFYPDYDDNTCRPCHSSCLTCVQGGEQDCMDCNDGKTDLVSALRKLQGLRLNL